MISRFIQFKQSRIAFTTSGTGEKILFCFHGFGEDSRTFSHLVPSLGSLYTIITIDLPFHGSTQWNEGLTMLPNDLIAILDAIISEPGIVHKYRQRYSLLGFSLGGRIAMHLAQLQPHRAEQLVLLAPDGLVMNFWYWLGTQTRLGNTLFAYTMRKPGWFFSLATTAGRLGLVNKSVLRFVHLYIDDKQARMDLYHRWTTLRKFKPSISTLSQLVQQHNIKVRFLFGRHDRIILHKRSAPFATDTRNVSITVIDAGHNLLREKYTPHIVQLFSR